MVRVVRGFVGGLLGLFGFVFLWKFRFGIDFGSLRL
jgi:hypothetical protein